MSQSNQMSRLIARLDGLPAAVRQGIQTLLLGKRVPFVGTAGLKVEELTHQRVVLSIQNRHRVQNHLKGIHAAAMALLVETASGFAVGMHLPDDKIPLLKSLRVDYLKRARGGLRAVVELSPEQVQTITSQEKGQLNVPVAVTDESGRGPIRCELVWAWIPKKKE